MTLDAAIVMSKVEDRVTVVSMASRPGARRFFMALEYGLFPPNTPHNQEFEYLFVNWPVEFPLIWSVAILPLLKFPEVRRIAKENGMRIADGVPEILGIGTSPMRFPINHCRAWTLENDLGSPVYLPHGDDFIRAEEARWIEAFMLKQHGPNWRMR